VPGDLPAALKQAIERQLEGVQRAELGRASTRLSEQYRSGGSSAAALADPSDILSYLAARMPATYAANETVLAELCRRAPDFAPTSLLDIGAGSGAASWAAVETWPGIGAVTMLDAHRDFLDMAGKLVEGSGRPALTASERIIADLGDVAEKKRSAMLVIASYALAEGATDAIPALVTEFWKATSGVLMLIEPGTPGGFARIRMARAALLSAGAEIVAPCPHRDDCPIIEPDWCHFSVRLPRTRDHRLAKSATLAFEDEKFSYVAVARPEIVRDVPAARVLSRPRMSKAEIRLKLCTPEGLVEKVVPRRDKASYAEARRLDWGDAV
jgi:ribosomal protein RSM22 (predicted rRNA methylase)